MLIVAQDGQPVAPHEAWGAWNLDPVLLGLLLVAVWLYRNGQFAGSRRSDVWRRRAFVAAIVVVTVALVSPLDAMSASLASAHMVQHVLLMLVAAPLFAFSAPASAILRGSPAAIQRLPSTARRRLRIRQSLVRSLSHPAVVVVVFICTLWFWHSAAAYDATLRYEAVHVTEHVSFLAVAVMFWRVVLGGRIGRRVPGGLGFLLVFGVAMASVLLSVLMTFATEHWYSGYTATTAAWGLEPLEDQQLAGLIMWVPSGLMYVGAALVVFASWLAEDHDAAPHHA